MICPRCNQSLQQKVYEGVTIDRCGKCHGVWLDDGEIAAIVETKEEKFSPEIVRDAINRAFAGIPTAVAAEAPEAKCPKCAKLMRLLNYGYDSGVIIDRCVDSHGVWLDSGEIVKIQAFRERWDVEAPQHRENWKNLLRSAEKKNPVVDAAKQLEHSTFMFRKFLGMLVK